MISTDAHMHLTGSAVFKTCEKIGDFVDVR